jgi:hypothetical protein
MILESIVGGLVEGEASARGSCGETHVVGADDKGYLECGREACAASRKREDS